MIDAKLVIRKQFALGWVAAVALAAVGCGAAVPRGGAAVYWRGDFDTGDLSQWESVQAVPGDVAVVSSPVREGPYAARFVVDPGDIPLGDGGERSEVRASRADSRGYEGDEAWYGFATMFPSNFNPTPGTTWNYFIQFHDALNNGCGPNIVYQVDESKSPAAIRLRVRGGSLSLSTCSAEYDRSWFPRNLTLNHWYDFVLHVKWSAKPSIGFVEGWIDGSRVIPKTYTATLYPGDGIYLKQGFYRKPSLLTSTVYQDAMRVGDGYASVDPATTSALRR